ncbi:MAG: hypothetical protein J3K34DRAFT_443870 [Monoraphidium minutum]|nr:MAG: hypothetical protein J3K34DRAFT_443870 [Monoraphidium minutum]
MVPFSRGRGCSPTPRSDRRRSRSRSPRGRGCNSSGAGHARSSPYGTPSCSPAARFGGGGRSLGGTPSCMGSGGTSPMAPSGGAAAAASGRGGAPAGVPRPRRGRREPNVAFYKQHLTTVVATNNTTLRQLLYGVLVTYVRDRLPRASVSSMLKLLKHTATAPDLIPTNPKTMLRILDVKDWSCFERHFCDGERCAGYVYDAAPRESWPGLPAQQRTCPKCQTPRFRTIYRGGREVLEPRAWFIDFGIKEVIASFFADPQFVAAWRQARVELRDAAETGAAEAGSWAAGAGELVRCVGWRARGGPAAWARGARMVHGTSAVGRACIWRPPCALAKA